jgi:hypothetical protein
MILLQLHLSPQTLNVQTQTNTTTCLSSPLSLPFQISSLLQVTSYKSTSFLKMNFSSSHHILNIQIKKRTFMNF